MIERAVIHWVHSSWEWTVPVSHLMALPVPEHRGCSLSGDLAKLTDWHRVSVNTVFSTCSIFFYPVWLPQLLIVPSSVFFNSNCDWGTQGSRERRGGSESVTQGCEEITVSGEWRHHISREWPHCIKQTNTGKGAAGAGMCAGETLEPLFYSPGMSFLLSTMEEHACTENCPQASWYIVCFIPSFFHIYPVKCPNQTVFTCVPKQATTVASYISSL